MVKGALQSWLKAEVCMTHSESQSHHNCVNVTLIRAVVFNATWYVWSSHCV